MYSIHLKLNCSKKTKQMASKETVFNEVSEMLKQLSIEVEIVDTTRPWGGFFVINENSAQIFIHHFFYFTKSNA